MGTANSDLEQHLERLVSVSWQDQQLRAALQRLSESQGVSLWLDRRIDPQQPVEATFQNLPLHQVLKRIAEQHSLGISALGNVVYVGPQQSASELATLAAKARDSLDKSAKATSRIWLQETSSEWAILSEPRTLLTHWVGQAGFAVQKPERIPHDLWDAKQLPPLALVDKTVLLLAGFDLTCQIDSAGDTCQIVPISRPVVLTRQYRFGPDHELFLARLQETIHEATFAVRGRLLTVTGRWEDHLQVQELIAGKPNEPSQKVGRGTTKPVEQRFSLQLKNQPVGAVVSQLADQLQLQVRWDTSSLAEAKRDQSTLVSCSVKDASLDELLKSILEPAGMQFERQGKDVQIKAGR
ncbi:MAG: hypothetical protein KDA57_13415 [Planctomycetales bacterium]|nr:hypothetical protein [Planctomycetales bacterium]